MFQSVEYKIKTVTLEGVCFQKHFFAKEICHLNFRSSKEDFFKADGEKNSSKYEILFLQFGLCFI